MSGYETRRKQSSSQSQTPASTAYYGSWTRTANSATGQAPFTNGTVAENVTPSGITYTNANGRFTVANAGKYLITANLFLDGGNAMSLYLKKNGTIVYTANTYVHTSVDPVERTMTIILDLSANDYIEAQNTVNSIARIGSSMTIQKIA